MRSQAIAHIAGAYEHPERKIRDKTVPQVVAEVAYGALRDAGLSLDDVDGYFCSSEVPGLGALSMTDYLGLRKLSYCDTTEGGGASYPMHVGHAAEAIAAGKCSVALITMAGIPSAGARRGGLPGAEDPFEGSLGITTPASYALSAQYHMHRYGTTSEQLAAIKVAASTHAQHNPNALLRTPVTVEEVVSSPMIADPLHRLDCCITTDGGGALVMVSPEVARSLGRRTVKVLGHAETIKHSTSGAVDLSYTSAAITGPKAFEAAGVRPADIDYASIYDSFTITVLLSLEDLGFCEKGAGGKFVQDGALLARGGVLPFNTDGGGLCNNHPDFRGGMIRTIEAVRQLRDEAAQEVQVPNCELAVVQGHGGAISVRAAGATVILGREDA
jgi:acetyl-CoA C-acetyltransferase